VKVPKEEKEGNAESGGMRDPVSGLVLERIGTGEGRHAALREGILGRR